MTQPTSPQDHGATQGAWFDVIRRARLPRHLKSTAMVIGSYADSDGTSVHPGVARLAIDLDIGYSTVKRHLTALRTYGLIEITARGNRRLRHSDTYRLTLSPDVLDHIAVLSPSAYQAADQGSPIASPDDAPIRAHPASDQGSPIASPDPAIRAHSDPDQGSPKVSSHLPHVPTTNPLLADLELTATVSREGERVPLAPPDPPCEPWTPVRVGGGSSEPKPERRYVSGPEALAERAARFGHLVTWAQDQADAVRLGWDPVTVRTVLASATRVENGAHTPDEIAAAWTRFLSGPPAPLHQFPRKAGRWWHTHPEPATPAAGEAP